MAGKMVMFQVCANALRDHRIETATLPVYAHIVPDGVITVAEARQDNIASIKP
jgi:intracellular sulfur oxidation DsrE/DsrF family protein